MAAGPDVVTLGETMALIAATSTGPFAVGSPARFSFAGAESNVAVGLARLGHSAAWVGCVGDDPLGAMILEGLRAAGVDVSGVRQDPELPTGLILREHRTADRVRVGYYRTGLAGSLLSPDDVHRAPIRSARILHLTGITPALSPSARDAVDEAVDVANEAGVSVSLDLNYRATLWSMAEAAAALSGLAERADVVFGGPEEIALVVGDGAGLADRASGGDAAEAERLAAGLAGRGPKQVVVKLAERGALALVNGGFVRAPGLPVTAVDPVGAGDAFVAGYLSALLDGLPPVSRLERANICGAYAVSVAGDWEGLPRRSELSALSEGDNVRR